MHGSLPLEEFFLQVSEMKSYPLVKEAMHNTHMTKSTFIYIMCNWLINPNYFRGG